MSIHARPASAVERLYRWGRRNPGWAATVVTICVLLTVSAGLSWKNITESEISFRRIQAEQKRTLAEEEKTRAALSTAKRTLYLASIRHAETAWQDGQTVTAQESLQQCPEEFRDWEWHFLNELCESSNSRWTNEKGEMQSIACDPASSGVYDQGAAREKLGDNTQGSALRSADESIRGFLARGRFVHRERSP